MQLLEKNKICFVLPWFGENIVGGAEKEARQLIKYLSKYFEIEILSTTVKDFFSDWNLNYYKEGIYRELGVLVRRFDVDKVDRTEFHNVNRLLMQGKNPNAYDEKVYLEGIINSKNLLNFIKLNKDNYKYFFFMPYMFGTTINGVLNVLDKSVLIPCLHDESYAKMTIFNDVFHKAFRVFFHMNSEKNLAEKLYGTSPSYRVVGEGVNFNFSGDSKKFYEKFKIKNFYLFIGRKDEGKNISLLLKWFRLYKKKNPSDLKLVLIGPLKIEGDEDIIDLGFLPENEKYDAISASLGLINLSLYESFSLVVLESAFLKKVVIVLSNCETTKEHCLNGNMGLYVKDYYEFSSSLKYLEKNPDIAKKLGENGYNYAVTNFSFEIVINKILENLL